MPAADRKNPRRGVVSSMMVPSLSKSAGSGSAMRSPDV
jgi:hypothetical protein